MKIKSNKIKSLIQKNTVLKDSNQQLKSRAKKIKVISGLFILKCGMISKHICTRLLMQVRALWCISVNACARYWLTEELILVSRIWKEDLYALKKGKRKVPSPQQRNKWTSITSFNHRDDLHWKLPNLSSVDQDQGKKAKNKTRCTALAVVIAFTGIRAVWVRERNHQQYANKQ